MRFVKIAEDVNQLNYDLDLKCVQRLSINDTSQLFFVTVYKLLSLSCELMSAIDLY